MLQIATPKTQRCDSRRRWLMQAAACLAGGGTPLRTHAEPDRQRSPVPALQFPIRFEPLGGPVYLVPAHLGDADAENRGFVAHLLLVVQAEALWLVGTGPSPAFGAALRAALLKRWPGRAIEAISPWAHPETVLGVAGLVPDRHWAHAEVSAQMGQRCEGCLQRLAQRMGPSAEDLQRQALGPSGAIRLPDPQRRLDGARGHLGPLLWWRVQRATDVTITMWRHTALDLGFAPGLLNGQGPPDGRDGDIEILHATVRAVQADAHWGRLARWVGQQGRVEGRQALERCAVYWRGLADAAMQGQERGDDGIDPPESLPDVPQAWCRHPLHALNWQRAWRQAESRWLQRSLR